MGKKQPLGIKKTIEPNKFLVQPETAFGCKYFEY